MKKRFIYILSVTLALALCLMGCGGGNKVGMASQSGSASQSMAASAATNGSAAWDRDMAEVVAEPYFPEPTESEYQYDYDSVSEEAGFSTSENPATAAESVAPPDSRKIIRHANMDLETMEFDAALADIQKMVAGAGGYIESQSQGGGTSYAYQGRYQEERYANIQARVPSDKLDGVMASVGGVCNVLSQSESMDDITDSYYDARARLDTLRIQEERLLAILEKAEKLEDVITLESALSEVRYQIESLTATLRRMDNQVTYSYLNLYLQEVVEYQQIQEKPRTYGERMREAAGDGVEAMVDGLQEFSLLAVRMGPSLLVWVVIIAVIVLIIRAIAKANAKRREEKGLPPRKPPLTYTTGTPGQSGFQRYPKAPPTPQAAPAEEQPKNEGDGE